MGYSEFLASKHDIAKRLVDELSDNFEQVSLLGSHVTGTAYSTSKRQTAINETRERDCGFVLKMYNGRIYSEYSFNDLTDDNFYDVVKSAINKTKLDDVLLNDTMKYGPLDDTEMIKTFYRPLETEVPNKEEIMSKLKSLLERGCAIDKIMDVNLSYQYWTVSKMFISNNKDLCQCYSWVAVMCRAVANEGNNTKSCYFGKGYNSGAKAFEELSNAFEPTCNTAVELLHSTNIEPGEYDVICEPSITGLIAHEAFGHGVEMDMFVKERAKSVEYINKQVASPLVTMHDGASAVLSIASYFFDDDGILASDTTIIKNGILQTGISDALSAKLLGTKPTGNGRRESYKRKTYTRMTNTFFMPGNDKKEDMIKSIKHGYLLCQTDNGMEDPKNWNIQCICAYGREIKDGEFTGKIVAPVCMSGYVLDLLNSISMVSDEWKVIGSGHCGKGYKEWVTVSDGGPYIKARCKLG